MKNMSMTRQKFFAVTFALMSFAVFGAARAARAATVTVTSSTIRINTEGQSVNAIEGHLTFNPQKFSVADIYDGGSVVDIWIQAPTFSNQNGTIDFSGIIPGGMVAASGTVLSFRLAPLAQGGTAGFLSVSARALLNDGLGTPAPLTIVNASFILGGPATASPTVSMMPPDPFLPQIGRDPDICGGGYFVAFSATDQQSGIDHYEILENDGTVWHNATSPHCLADQGLSSPVYIRAIDKAGNFRIVKLPASHQPQKVMQVLVWVLAVGFGILIVSGISFFLAWRKKREREARRK